MKKLIISILFALIALNTAALAQDFSVSLDTKDYYVVTQEDYITLTLNNQGYEDWFSIALIGPEKWVSADTSLLRVPTAGSNTMKITVNPPKDAIPLIAPYQYFLKIGRIGTNETIEQPILMRIKQITNAIIKGFKLSCTECMDSVDASGTVYNVGSDSIDLSLVFRLGDQVKTVPLDYVNIYGKKDFEANFPLKGMAPGAYNLSVDLIDKSGNLMYTEAGSFNIPAVENVIYNKSVSSTIFGSFITVTATNKGNTVSDVDLSSVDPSSWYSLYSGPAPTGMSITDNYFWSFSLNPNEMKGVSYSAIYWPTYVIILLVVVVAVILFTQFGAFSLDKTIMGDNSFRPGKEVSVSLNLKNKSGEIDRAVVRDVVPQGYDIVSKFDTVKPIIRKIPEGVELNWKVSKLRPDEERVFHYTIKPTEEVNQRLPSAKVRAVQNNRLVQKDSNRVSFTHKNEKKNVLNVSVSK